MVRSCRDAQLLWCNSWQLDSLLQLFVYSTESERKQIVESCNAEEVASLS